jgi:sugar phosphate permease
VLGDRLGVRHVLTVIVLGWSVLTGAIGLVLLLPAGTAWPLIYLLTLRALFGAFQGGMFPLASRMLADWLPVGERGMAQGFLWTSSRVGGAISSLVVVALFHKVGVGQLAFWLLASVGFVWCALFWPWFRNAPREMPGVNPAERKLIESGRPPGATTGHGGVPWGLMFRSRSAWCVCLTYGALGLTGNFFITLLPNYLRTHRGFNDTTAAWISFVPLACGVVGCLLGGAASDLIIRRTGTRRWGRRLVGSFGLALGTVAVASTILVRDPLWLAVLLGLAFFGNDLAMGPAWAACADIGERSAGTLGGAMNMFASFGGALGAFVAGELLERNLATALFLFLASSYALGSLLWMGVDTSRTLTDGKATAAHDGLGLS